MDKYTHGLGYKNNPPASSQLQVKKYLMNTTSLFLFEGYFFGISKKLNYQNLYKNTV